MEHFGVTVRLGKHGLKLERETYAPINQKSSFSGKLACFEENNAYADPYGKCYTLEWCNKYQTLCLDNFDLNMCFFNSLNHDDFESELSSFLNLHPSFAPVYDLKKYSAVKGYYLMVLDEYCQLYIGTTNDIKTRIQQHWSRTKPLDRLLFPPYAVDCSVLSIDSFRALDTTRIFAYPTSSTYELENSFINHFSNKFIANRIGGGKLAPGTLGLLQAAESTKAKDLTAIEQH